MSENDLSSYVRSRMAVEPKAFVKLVGGHNTGGLMASPDAQKELADFLARVIAATG